MNIPFRFSLNTVAAGGPPPNNIGLLLLQDGSANANQTLSSIVTNPAIADGLGITPAARRSSCGLSGIDQMGTTRPFVVTGFSIDGRFTTDIAPKVDIGLWDTTNSVFIPLYECEALSVSGGGIQKTMGGDENGILFPQSATLQPAVRITKQGAAPDGPVIVCGDLSVFLGQP